MNDAKLAMKGRGCIILGINSEEDMVNEQGASLHYKTSDGMDACFVWTPITPRKADTVLRTRRIGRRISLNDFDIYENSTKIPY